MKKLIKNDQMSLDFARHFLPLATISIGSYLQFGCFIYPLNYNTSITVFFLRT